ncbi:YhcN/YlaJ family sporulation lipoprotein [Pseudoneobacillus sp. C159]
MNKKFIALGFCGVIALTGCNANQMAQRDIYEESGHTINVNTKRSDLYNANNKNMSKDFGYVRHQKNPMVNGRNSDHHVAIDREKLADHISKVSTDLPNVHDVATLVTDEEVLIAYATDSKDRNLTADQVKRTALSFVPRYYHVYVSDNPNLIKNVESYANLSSNSRNADQLVDRLILKMLNSPQGYTVSNNENENGVSNEEMRPKMDRGFNLNSQ